VTFPGEEGKLFLEKEIWKNIRYTLDDHSGQISEKELGSFCQYPIRLAWAITIHKSQGLTFDRAIIDAGDSFTSGQVYVALSRLRDIKGLVLRTPIEKKSIISDWQLQEQQDAQTREELMNFLEEEQQNYLQTILFKSMDWNPLILTFNEFIEEYKEKQVSYREEALHLGNICLKKAKELSEVAGKFQAQIGKLYSAGSQAYPVLSERMEAAYEYFSKLLDEGFQHPVDSHYHEMQKKARMGKYLKTIQGLKHAVVIRIQEIKQARDLAEGLAKGEKITGLLTLMNRERKIFMSVPEQKDQIPKPTKGDTKKISFEMYRQGKSVHEIARERMLQPGTIESHLLHFIREGELEVYALISEEKYRKLQTMLKQKTYQSLSGIKYELGDEYSYSEIRAVLNYLEFLKKNPL
jgi:uncharacterized protein YpbB